MTEQSATCEPAKQADEGDRTREGRMTCDAITLDRALRAMADYLRGVEQRQRQKGAASCPKIDS